MSDLIDRQAAIATAISGRVRTLPTKEDGEDWIRVNEVRESLLNLPTAEPRWIPVTERLPDENEKVLITYIIEHERYTGQDCVNDGKWGMEMLRRHVYPNLEVVAWMPMPTPWKGESDG